MLKSKSMNYLEVMKFAKNISKIFIRYIKPPETPYTLSCSKIRSRCLTTIFGKCSIRLTSISVRRVNDWENLKLWDLKLEIWAKTYHFFGYNIDFLATGDDRHSLIGLNESIDPKK